MLVTDADIAIRGWGPVTVRVAWTLATEGVRARAETLRDARDHVWFHLAPDVSIDTATDRAEELTRAFVARAYGRDPSPRFPEDADMVPRRHWRDRLFRGLSRNARSVLRMHLADRYPLAQVAERLREDVIALEAAHEGLREVLRRAAAGDGVSLDGWNDARIDHLLHRLAVLPSAKSPPLLEVVDGLHPDHLQSCVPSARAHNLVRSGALRRADLVAPAGAARPKDRVTVLALHLHPRVRHLRPSLANEFGVRVFPMPDDVLVVDFTEPARVIDVLRLAAEVGAPCRDHLRGTVLTDVGRWSAHGLLGPVLDQVAAAVRPLGWGDLDQVGTLPEPLPEPPSARWAWAGVVAAALIATLTLQYAFRPEPPRVDHPLAVQATPARKGVWLDFDVDEDAYVIVVRQQGEQLDVILDSHHIRDKVQHATGDGGYRLHALGEGVLVASASHPIASLPDLVGSAHTQPQPLEWLAASIRADDPRADVHLRR